jgi:periplasmic protein TonB
MNATLNTFPPFQSMGSPRGWILAAIALLHLGFFYVLSSGLMPNIFPTKEHRTDVVMVASEEQVIEPQPTRQIDVDTLPPLYVPVPDDPVFPQDDAPTATRGPTTDSLASLPTTGADPIDPAPIWTQPEIDPKRPLSEPMYPSRAIREGWAGTVTLSVYVLENGRVGDVRLDKSSGFPELDAASLREAKRWRLRPGMRDGIAVAMWKQIPITFELKGESSRRF